MYINERLNIKLINCFVQNFTNSYSKSQTTIFTSHSQANFYSNSTNTSFQTNLLDPHYLISNNFSSIAKLSNAFIAKLTKIQNTSYDSHLKAILSLWEFGGIYIQIESINTINLAFNSTHELKESFNYICNKSSCKLISILVNKQNCLLQLAIKNYLLYFEKHKIMSIDSILVNLYKSHNKFLKQVKGYNKKSIYYNCFKSLEPLDKLFVFNHKVSNSEFKVSNETCI